MAIKDKRFSTLGSLGNDGSNFSLTATGSPYVMELTEDPLRIYPTVGRFRLEPGATRVELSGHVDRDPTFETAHWLWWSVYVPKNWTQCDDRLTILQVHEEPDTSPADVVGGPQIHAYIRGDRVKIESNYCTTSQTGSLSAIVSRTIANWPLSDCLGRWTDVVMNAKWSYSGTGYLKFWRNRRRIFDDASGNNAFNNAVARGGNEQPFHKLGLYGISGAASVANEVLHAGVIRGDNSYATFDAFMTACGFSDRTELEPVFGGRFSVGA